jgi:hypothetical protein
VRLSALAGGDAAYYLRAVFYHLTCVERALAACESLYDYLGILIYQYAHFSCEVLCSITANKITVNFWFNKKFLNLFFIFFAGMIFVF